MSVSGNAGAEPRTTTVRRVALPRGDTLVIRPIASSDVEGLTALYAGLDQESRYRRFFSVFRPDEAFFERMTTVAERGGAGLVAEVTSDPAGRPRLVAEASYTLLPNGDGELEITVDGAWRGWLGPFLLDALVEVAAAHGVPNLEADVLVSNGPMLALLRSRGYATIPKGDWTVLRAMIGTSTRAPSWPDGGPRRLRVLVEGAGGHWHAEDAATAAGLEVLGCPGPASRASRCPALAGEPCPLAAGADTIVISHPLDTDDWRSVRSAHGRLHAGVPVCVEIGPEGGTAAPGETPLSSDADVDVVAIVQRTARQRAAASSGTGG